MATLDRLDISNAILSLLKSDSTLYGQGKLINKISIRWQDYENAKVDRKNPYQLFLKTPTYEKIQARMQSSDYMITCEYRGEGRTNNAEDAWQWLDDISERIDYLVDNVMWSGDHLTSHYTNTEATLINIEHTISDQDVIDEGSPSAWRAHLDGIITVEIQRTKDNS